MKPPEARRVPGWLILLIVAGVPTLVTIVGSLLGAHAIEIVVFSLLCLFSVALMFFYALG
ncbi:MAG TPA: hypothetical protein PLX97_04780 [Gemmatales bacterium]|nr:hypothetical protein [Gemmatales bacterium]